MSRSTTSPSTTTHRVPPPAGGYVAGCAQLAVGHGLTFILWRDVDPNGQRYRVNVRLGNRDGPFPWWAQVFDVSEPVDRATEHVAATAWKYFTETGYHPPGSNGLTARA